MRTVETRAVTLASARDRLLHRVFDTAANDLDNQTFTFTPERLAELLRGDARAGGSVPHRPERAGHAGAGRRQQRASSR